MKTAAICNCKDICAGLQLVGVEAYFATTHEEAVQILENLVGAGIIIFTKNFECDPIKLFLEDTHVLPVFI